MQESQDRGICRSNHLNRWQVGGRKTKPDLLGTKGCGVAAQDYDARHMTHPPADHECH